MESSNVYVTKTSCWGAGQPLCSFSNVTFTNNVVLSSLFLEIIAWKWFPVKDVTKKIRWLCLLTFTTNDALSPPIVRPLFPEFYILPSYALYGVAPAWSFGCLVLITFLYPLVNWSCALFGVDKVQKLSKLADGKVGGGNKNYRNKFKNRKLKKCENIATYKLQSAHNLCKLADGWRLLEGEPKTV